MFYSAAEENSLSQAPSPPSEDEVDSATDNFESELSGTDGGDLSDDSEDMISLSAPLLPPQSTGALSSFTSATPQLGGLHTNGIPTPGSVFSSFTATTVRGPGSRGRPFEAQGLLERIPDELIYPKPGSDDDEEARIFVETSALAKIRCFSGDWVKIEASAEPQHPLGSWGLGAFGDEHEDQTEWRAAKVFGLPENLSKKAPRYPVNWRGDRRSSISQFGQPSPAARVHLSPLLLSNLGQPSHLLISPLPAPHPPGGPRAGVQKNRITSSSAPPYAKEVSLLKLATPLSSEITLQPSLFAALKDHFEQKRRIVKSCDLIGITVDASLGRAVFQGSEDNTNDELLSQTKREDTESSSRASKGVVWFKVDNVVSGSNEPREDGDQDVWGGVTTIDPAISVLKMGATVQGKVPPAISSSWQYYLGVKSLPMSSNGSPAKAPGIAELPKPYVSSLRRRLRELISAATSPRAIHLGLPPLAILLTSSQRGIGKATTATRACEDLGLHTFTIDSFDIVTEGGAGGGDNKTEATLEMRADRAFHCGAEYTALLIKHIDALNADRMVTVLKKVLADSRVLIATTTEVDKVSEGIRGLFTHELELSAPDEAEREGILRGIIEDTGIRLAPSVDLSSVAVKTAALVASDLVDVLDRALVAKRSRLESLVSTSNASLSPALPITLKDIQLSGGPSSTSLTKPDLDAAVDAARKNFADAIGAPKIPNVSWSDVGGLTHVKDAVMETIQLPLSRPELFAKGMKKRSGILFYGPPGTGKTLLAKAIATEFSLNFFSVKGPELLNMYIGESEANVRRVFQRARDARPCVVFFDELDSVAPKRGNQGDSGGVMDRIVSQLLAELDGMSDGGEGVFVIGATNRPDLLDQALLRPGRFDKMLYLGSHSTSLSLRQIASQLPFTYTGADLYALCSDAMLKAITRTAHRVDAKVAALNIDPERPPNAPPITIAHFFDHFATAEDTAVEVTEEDFVAARRELVPSVSADELVHYERVRRTFEGVGSAKEKGERLAAGQLADRTARELESSRGGPKFGNTGRGKGKGKGKSASHHGDDVSGNNRVLDGVGKEEDSEDEYVIRTDHLKANGSVTGTGVSKGQGKGKGKNAAADVDDGGGGFGDAAERDEEELYS
ncbi:peroxisomal assembly protein [Coniosporium tulheliwenetii]|uniref:Peroxisomal assembly protein n=1 Tax=Coniosporium tulheliwenetii TaxID=3383036 RepID=A0ACC2ZGW6_9PEZI|nr:peroxisomal assembly protein [Cladosporium sp. JES 115]